jgi:hypothetical protein
MAGLWNMSEALPLPLRWAAAGPQQAPMVAPQQGGVPVGAGMPGDPGTNPQQWTPPVDGRQLIPGQPITDYVMLTNGGLLDPALWNSLQPNIQELVLHYGWPLPQGVMKQSDPLMEALGRAQAAANLQATQRSNAEAARNAQLQRQMLDDPRGTVAGIGAWLGPQEMNNVLLMQRGFDPRTVSYDPEYDREQDALAQANWERQHTASVQNANRDYNARLLAIAQSLAANATDADMAAWRQRTEWGLPNAGDLYSLQQPGGMIDSVFRQQGWAYTPTPAQHLPAPSLWDNWARAQQEVR